MRVRNAACQDLAREPSSPCSKRATARFQRSVPRVWQSLGESCCFEYRGSGLGSHCLNIPKILRKNFLEEGMYRVGLLNPHQDFFAVKLAACMGRGCQRGGCREYNTCIEITF